MTVKDKELIVTSVCSRLPYGSVEVNYDNEICDCVGYIHGKFVLVRKFYSASFGVKPEEVKPDLRPMSSMTKKEEKEYSKYAHFGNTLGDWIKSIVFLNKHHFDHYGLIDKNLAIEMTNNMY